MEEPLQNTTWDEILKDLQKSQVEPRENFQKVFSIFQAGIISSLITLSTI